MRSAFVLLLSILATPAFAGTLDILIPAKYDGAYSGRSEVRLVDPSMVVEGCFGLSERFHPKPIRLGFYTYGCSVTDAARGVCHVIVINRQMGDYSPVFVLRHEMAHCAGWAADHPLD
jgi:hypothetical protein